MKHSFIYESTIECSAEELFAFHADTQNLSLITPPWIKVDILDYEPPMQEGKRVALRIKKWFISFEWELLFEEVTPPHEIIDRSLRSPFKFFRHSHQFIPINRNRTILKDTVTFALPLQPLSFPFVWLVKYDLKRMFHYRHAVTAKRLSK